MDKMPTDVVRLLWYGICKPDPNDESKDFVIGYDLTGSFGEHVVHEFFETDEYKELKEQYPDMKCYTAFRTYPRMWVELACLTPEDVWHICQSTGRSPSKVLSALVHRQMYRDCQKATEEYIEENGEEPEEEILAPHEWLYEKDATKVVTDCLSQAFWEWYGVKDERARKEAIARDREFETFKMYWEHRRSEAMTTCLYLYPHDEKKVYVGYVDKKYADMIKEAMERDAECQ